MRGAWFLLWLTACNAVFGIEETAPVDAAVEDRDSDGVSNIEDNCPDIANPPQHDEDQDGIGDACDNCPMHENVRQADTDEDTVGDVCDPHPITPGDCLAVFDGFNEPAALAASWDIRQAGIPGPTMMSMPGVVSVSVPGGADLAFAARGLSGSFDMQLLGSFDITVAGGSVSAAVNATATGGVSCTASYNGIPETPQSLHLDVNGASSASGTMSTRRVGSRLLIRVGIAAGADLQVPRCRIDHGVSAGTISHGKVDNPIPPGTIEMAFRDVTGDVYAASAYTFDIEGTTCAPAVLR